MGGDGCIHGLDGRMFPKVYAYPQTHGAVYINEAQLLHVNHTSVQWLEKRIGKYSTHY